MTNNHTVLSQLAEPIDLGDTDPRAPQTFGLTHHALCQVQRAPDGAETTRTLLPQAPYPTDLRGPALVVDLEPVLYGTYLPLDGASRDAWAADSLLLEFHVTAADPAALALALAHGEDPVGTLLAAAAEVVAHTAPEAAQAALSARLETVARPYALRIANLSLRREWLAASVGEAADFPDVILAELPPMPSPDDEPTAAAERTADAPVRLRLDAAAPRTVFVERAFTLAVALREADAPLPEEPGLELHRSAHVLLAWPEDTPSVLLRVHVAAPDCRFEDGDERTFRLFHDQEAPLLYFQVTPLRPADIGLVITVYQEDETLGAARLVTHCEAAPSGSVPAGAVALTLTSLPLEPRLPAEWTRERVVAFRDALAAAFDVEELQDLCFRLGIEYEDLPADTKSGKVRELVELALRHGRFDELVEIGRALRPGVIP